MLSKRILVLMFVVLFLPLVGCFPAPTPPNETPIITSTPITAATIGVLYAYDVNATDPDGDTLTYSLAVKPTGMIINSVTGVIFWTPVAAQIGNNSVTVKVSDGSLSITQSFIIKVSKLTPTPINHAPVITPIPNLTATVGTVFAYDVNAADPDGDVLTYSLIAPKPTNMNINSASGVIIWTPTLVQVGNNSVIVKVSDGTLYDTQSFTITVSKPTPTPINQVPVIYSIPNLMAIVGVAFTYEVEAFDPDGDDLTYSLTDRPKGMEIESGTGKITWIPTSIQTGYNAVIVSVSDGYLSVTKYFAIAVDPVTLIGIEVNPEAMDLLIGKQRYITEITAHYNNETTAPVAPGDCTYRTNDSGVAEVDFNGLITAVAEGKATITITYKTDWRTFTDTVKVTVKVPPPVIDGILSPGEWAGATEISVASDMGTVWVLATTDYLYVAFDVNDETDAREGAGAGSDKFGINVNPTDGASFGYPCELIFQIAMDTTTFGSPTSSGILDGFKTYWGDGIVQESILPVDLESVTLYGGGRGITEWKIPLVSQPGDIIKVGGCTDIERISYKYPAGLEFSNASTFIDIVAY